jgi:hypothetical protein
VSALAGAKGTQSILFQIWMAEPSSTQPSGLRVGEVSARKGREESLKAINQRGSGETVMLYVVGEVSARKGREGHRPGDGKNR